MSERSPRPRVAVHKFSSCDGCQLALLNLGEGLLHLAELVDIVHFPEAGPVDEEAAVDIALIEGSVSTPHEVERIARIRSNSRYLVAMGACATSGGVQALRNQADARGWAADVYARPEHLELLDTATALSRHVRVDLELYGCPVNGHQVLGAVRALLSGVTPVRSRDKLCVECKRQHHVCVVVAKGLPCLGPVTVTGCGVLCPALGRDCYGCAGPAEAVNPASLAARFAGLGLDPQAVRRRFQGIHSQAEPFAREAERLAAGEGA